MEKVTHAFSTTLLAASLALGAGSALAILLGSPGDVGVGASGGVFGLFGVWAVSAFQQRNTRRGRAQFNAILFNLAINAAIPLFIPRFPLPAILAALVIDAADQEAASREFVGESVNLCRGILAG